MTSNCVYYSICGNTTAGDDSATNQICDGCLDAVRKRSHEIDAQQRDQFSDEDVADSRTYLQQHYEP